MERFLNKPVPHCGKKRRLGYAEAPAAGIPPGPGTFRLRGPFERHCTHVNNN
jgi:hypothetical protein